MAFVVEVEEVGTTFPSLEEIKDSAMEVGCYRELVDELRKSVDACKSGDFDVLYKTRVKHVELLGALRLKSVEAADRMQVIKSEIVKAFYDSPRAFIPNAQNKNLTMAESVYKTHPDYRNAVQEFYQYATMMEMVRQMLLGTQIKSERLSPYYETEE